MIAIVGRNETVYVISFKKGSKGDLLVQFGRDKWWEEKPRKPTPLTIL